jgi:integrase
LLEPLLPSDPDALIFRNGHGAPMTRVAYQRVIGRACVRAGVEVWNPNQLRHTGATRIREQASLDAAQVILGHSTIATSQIYAAKNVAAALAVAAKLG